MPPKLARVDAPASVRSLKLHVRTIANPTQFISSVADPFRPALVAALVEAGLQPVDDPASADGMLDMTLGHSKDTMSYYTILRLSAEGRKIESVDLEGGGIGNRLNTGMGIPEAITANLVTQLAASPKVEAFSLEPR